MDVAFNWYSVTLLFGFVHGLLFGGSLCLRALKRQRLSDLILGFLLFLGSMLIMPFMLGFMGINLLWEAWLFFPRDPGLLIGPTLYFYLVALTDTTFRFKRKHAIHALPFLLLTLYQLLVFALGQGFVKEWLSRVHYPYLAMPIEVGTFLSNMVYLLAGIVYFRAYRAWILTEYADTETLQFGWIYSFLFALTGGILLSWGFDAFDLFGGGLAYTDAYWKFLGISVLVYFLGFTGYKQDPPLFLAFSERHREKAPVTSEVPSASEINSRLKNELLDFMLREKPFLNTSVSISDLARRLGTNKTTLSQLINSAFDKNFNQFINGYRVEACKQQMLAADLSRTTLLGVAMNCGFNSKATFNRVFKDQTGMTPRAFTKQSRLGRTIEGQQNATAGETS